LRLPSVAARRADGNNTKIAKHTKHTKEKIPVSSREPHLRVAGNTAVSAHRVALPAWCVIRMLHVLRDRGALRDLRVVPSARAA
jgi:hypothetical protein